MPSHLYVYLRERIVVMWEEGNMVSKILTSSELCVLLSEDGYYAEE